MFNDSYSNPKTVQDFDPEIASCTINAYLKNSSSNRQWASVLHNNLGLNVFNSSSISSFAGRSQEGPEPLAYEIA